MEGIIIIGIEDGIPLKTLSSGWGVGGILISIGNYNTRDHKKKKSY